MSDTQNPEQFIALKIKELMSDDNVLPIYFFSGSLSYQIMDKHLSELKDCLKVVVDGVHLQKRIYSIIVEALDNSYRHGYPHLVNGEEKEILSFLVLANYKQNIKIWVGNYINNISINDYENHFKSIINKKTKNELSNEIKSTLKSNLFSEQTNAGIGLMDISRKLLDTGKIAYNIDPYNSNISLLTIEFYLTLTK